MKELKTVALMLGTMLTKEELDDFMAEADKNGDGKLDYDEFVKILLGWKLDKVWWPIVTQLVYLTV